MKNIFTPLDAVVQNEVEAKKRIPQLANLNINFTPCLLLFDNNNNSDTASAFCWKATIDNKTEVFVFAFKDDQTLMGEFDNYEIIKLSQESTFIIGKRIFTIKHSAKGYELMELTHVYSERQVRSIARVMDADPNLTWNICLGYYNQKPLCYVWRGRNTSPNATFIIPIFGCDVDSMEFIEEFKTINKERAIITQQGIFEVETSQTEGTILKHLCPAVTSLPS